MMGYWRITLTILLMIAGLCTALAFIGTASMQAVCNSSPSALPEMQSGGGAPFRRSLSCGSVLRLPWAILALHAAALVGASLSLCLGGLAHTSMSWLAMFAILSALSIFIADAFVALQSTPLFGWRQQPRREGTAVGTAAGGGPALPVKY